MFAEQSSVGEFWGEHALDVNQSGFWQIGALKLWAKREDQQWHVAYHMDGNAEAVSRGVPASSSEFSPPEDAETLRLVYGRSPEVIRLSAALADRPVVVRPETPLRLMPREQIRLYVCTPLWVRVEFPGSSCEVWNLPAVRLSDTWFGQSTRMGELCYEGRVVAELNPDQLKRSPFDAVTVVMVDNRDSKPLALDRISLPLPHLALLREPSGWFWTQAVHVKRAKDGGIDVRLNGKLADIGRRLEPIAEPRKKIERSSARRALSVIMG